MPSARPRLLVRVVRRLKQDDAFDIDPDLPLGALLDFALQRAVMAVRGLGLSLRTRRFVVPVFVGRGVVVTNPRSLRLGRAVTIGDFCRLDCLGRTGIVLGDGVTLRRGVQIEVTSVLRQLGEGCVVGNRTGISEGTFVGAKGLVTIGSDAMIGPQCVIVSENHVFDEIERPIREQGVSRIGVAIGSDCWLGAGVRVLDGVKIGTGAVVGAGAVVIHDIAARAVEAGIPAKPLRTRG